MSAAARDVSSALTVFDNALPCLVLVAVFCEPLLLLVLSVGVNGFSAGVGLARGAFFPEFFPIARVMTFLSAPATRGLASEMGVARMKSFSCVYDCE